MKDRAVQDDREDYDKSLHDIAKRYGRPIISILLDVQQTRTQQQKFFRFIKQLECFYLDPKSGRARQRNRLQHETHVERTPILRRRINAFQVKKFVAISYPSEPSDKRQNCKSRYEVENRNGEKFYPSTVRDVVWDRAFRYMRTQNVKFVWIDRQSIPQNECKDADCSHKMCKRKRASMQTMDLVYKLSAYPVALLERQIYSSGELYLLKAILRGKLVKGNEKTRQFRLSAVTTVNKARKALRLLIAIIKDRWWTRAWTFQENYVARKRMVLLMPHSIKLEAIKRRCEIFGNVPGELCIKSVDFHRQATRLCLALQVYELKGIDKVLRAAGEYRLLLQSSDSMTARVINDLKIRHLKYALDSLPIIANCCQYPDRLNIGSRHSLAHSLSLSILTMCLLNGEILHNGLRDSAPGLTSRMTVSEYLSTQLFNEFYSPNNKPNLTFNKSCRFIKVRLTPSGIQTEGHLWKLGPIIDTATFPSKVPRIGSPSSTLRPHQQDRLAQLASILRSISHGDLASAIEAYISRVPFGSDKFPRRYLRMMAEEVVRAIDKRQKLRLASLCVPQKKYPYMAIFIWDDYDNRNSLNSKSVARGMDGRSSYDFAFTASALRKQTMPDLDRHVSLQVQYPDAPRQADSGAPRLYIIRWLIGLCFFRGCRRRQVVFPWPPALESVKA
ncbi:hypothetical protein HD806DRAFT_477421 [Xylariaceae sp. AK1471]|nr:hypothetical protein HD806DRAFT_477421 [Xylariaceae sp. AK1471]